MSGRDYEGAGTRVLTAASSFQLYVLFRYLCFLPDLPLNLKSDFFVCPFCCFPIHLIIPKLTLGPFASLADLVVADIYSSCSGCIRMPCQRGHAQHPHRPGVRVGKGELLTHLPGPSSAKPIWDAKRYPVAS